MLKNAESITDLQVSAAGAVNDLMAETLVVRLEDIETQRSLSDRSIDILALLNLYNWRHLLVCEVKSIVFRSTVVGALPAHRQPLFVC